MLTVSKPIELCYPMTYIHAIANELFPFAGHLRRAAEEGDPVLRMKHVIAATVHSYSANLMVLCGMIPLDPVLGETFQGKFETCDLYIEYTRVVPPTYHSMIVDREGRFTLRATHVLKVSANSVNSIKGESKGYHEVYFKDSGLKIRISHAPMIIDQLLMGETSYNLFDGIDFTTNQDLSARVDFRYQN